MKRGKTGFTITPYICQKSKCKKFVTKINGVNDRYCDEHFVAKEHKPTAEYAARHGNILHTPINPEDYYEKFKG